MSDQKITRLGLTNPHNHHLRPLGGLFIAVISLIIIASSSFSLKKTAMDFGTEIIHTFSLIQNDVNSITFFAKEAVYPETM